MPEGDAVWRTASRLHTAFAGQPLTVADLRWPGISTADLRGMITTEVLSRGKHLLHRLDSGWTIHSHLRMDGSWQVFPTARAGGHGHAVRAVLGTAQWTARGVRLGRLDLVRTRDEDTLVGHLGPDLLGPDWDLGLAVARVGSSGTTLGAALLDQSNLAGIGTIWASECLFAERLNPWAMASELPASTIERLVARAQRLIDRARLHRVERAVYGRPPRGCVRCGGPIRLSPIGDGLRQRRLYHCPACQQSPTDVRG